MSAVRASRGFTLVELLIVIVVIAILAAITIVAYGGVTAKANQAAMKADLAQSVTTLETDKVTNGTYPDTQADANLKDPSPGTFTYNYVDATGTFCLQEIRNNTAFYVTDSNESPQSGGCPITNLVANPTAGTDLSGWSANANYTLARVQVGGTWSVQATRGGTAATAVYCSSSPASPVTANATYTASAYVTSSVTGPFSIRVRRGGTTSDIYASSDFTLQANVPQRISVTGNVGTATTAYVTIYSASGSVGDVLTINHVMLTQGSGLFNYGDGDSPGWSWSGTAEESASSGPASVS